MKSRIDQLVEKLAAYQGENVYNPWRDYDPTYDRCEDAPTIRKEHLKQYLYARVGKCKHIVCAEAIGYQGGRFTGIAITCERMLLGNHKQVDAYDVFPKSYIPENLAELRTSDAESEMITKRTQKELGFNEPTDTVVWGAIKENEMDPFKVLLWNIFPFHPHKPNQPLTNRTPSLEELEIGWSFARDIIALNNELLEENAKVLAVGKKATQTLGNFGCNALELRHPANGGAGKYRLQFTEIVKGEK